MGQRLALQTLFETILGTNEVYFQPPPNVNMRFPAIVYKREAIETRFANNHPYHLAKRYEVQVVDRNPDSEIPDRVAMLPMCLLTRTFASENLNHYVFILYF